MTGRARGPQALIAFLETLLRDQRAHRAYWSDLPNDRDPHKPTARECVLAHLDSHILELEEALWLGGGR